MVGTSRYIATVTASRLIFGLAVCGFCLSSSLSAFGQSDPSPRLDARIVSMPKVERKLEVIQNRSQLIKTSKRVVRMAIADPSVIDIAPFEENEFAIIGAALGTTTLTLWFEDDNDPLIYEVTTIRDPDIDEQIRIDYGKLERKLSILFPNSKVYLIPLHEKLVVKGQARDGAEAARILQIIRGEFIDDYGGLYGPGGSYGRGGRGLDDDNDFLDEGDVNDDLFSSFIVNMLQVPGEFQVMLHVTIAELNRSQLRRMGVDLNVIINDTAAVLNSTLAGGASTISGVFDAGNVSALINALASNGTAKILSRPSLTTLSGNPATFLAGGEFAVPTTVGVGGVGVASTTFRGFGTSMLVIPTVIDGDLIRMRITPQFSEIDSNNAVNGIPGLATRTVSTTVELREGQSIVLGGLLSRQQATEVTRIPLLGDIPLIGPTLFSSKRATEDELELLVLVTPEIVRAMDPDEVPPMPGFEVTHPNDVEFYRYAMTEGAPDTEVYQLAPYGNEVGYPNPVGFNVYNPSPATPQYGPIPQANQPSGVPSPAPWMNQGQRPNQQSQSPSNSQMMNQGSPNGQPMYQQGQMMPGQTPQMSPYTSPQRSPGYSPQADPRFNMSPGTMQQMPMNPGQMAPGTMMPGQTYQQQAPQWQPGPTSMRQTPNSGAQKYRGGQPTASRRGNGVQNYGQQLFQQPNGANQANTYVPAGYNQRR